MKVIYNNDLDRETIDEIAIMEKLSRSEKHHPNILRYYANFKFNTFLHCLIIEHCFVSVILIRIFHQSYLKDFLYFLLGWRSGRAHRPDQEIVREANTAKEDSRLVEANS